MVMTSATADFDARRLEGWPRVLAAQHPSRRAQERAPQDEVTELSYGPYEVAGSSLASFSAAAAAPGGVTLKNGSMGVVGHSAMAMPWRAVHTSILCRPSSISARRRSARSATGQTPTTG